MRFVDSSTSISVATWRFFGRHLKIFESFVEGGGWKVLQKDLQSVPTKHVKGVMSVKVKEEQQQPNKALKMMKA